MNGRTKPSRARTRSRFASALAPVLAIAAVLVGPGAARAEADPSAVERAVAALIDRDRPQEIDDAEIERRRALVEPVAEDDPGNWRFALAMAALEQYAGNGSASLEWAERAVDASPRRADAHYAHGMALLLTVEDVSIFRKMGRAKAARDAWEEAVRLDGEHAPARLALAGFYLFAPGIAGGDADLGQEHARALTNIDGWGHLGHVLMGTHAAREEEWREMRGHFTAAEQAAEDPGDRDEAVRAHVFALLRQKEDASAAKREALAALERHDDAGPTVRYALAEAHRALGEWADAEDAYRAVLDASDEAPNSIVGLGLVLSEQGDHAGAAAAFERYLREHPEGSRIEEARDGLRRARRAVR